MFIFILLAFVVVFGVVVITISLSEKVLEQRRRNQVTAILKTVSGEAPVVTTNILKETPPGDAKDFASLLARLDFSKRLQAEIAQAGLDWTPSKLLGTMVVAGLAGGALAFLVPLPISKVIAVPALFFLFFLLPKVYVSRKRKKRLGEIEEQFPEALDFLARSMRAGHAFTISLGMLGDEVPAPLGNEIRQLYNEQNLGAPLEVAMSNLCQRVPLLDVRFFASSVMLQRQTGGNLSEILTRLSYVIRERFRLKGQVKAASAHGRMTASILTAMPVVSALALMVVAPGYLDTLVTDPEGKYLLGGAVFAQVLGNYCIKRIIDIKV